MRELNDWRLTNQERYLTAVTLVHSVHYTLDPVNDHDHCEFCFAKFKVSDPDALHKGYRTKDGDRWVCDTCFEDFKDLFSWQLGSAV